MRSALYVRISRNPDGTSEAPTRQLEDCRRYVEARGWTVHDVFTDDDISAYRKVRRPSFERLIEAVRTKDVQVVVAWRLDRLARQTRDLVRLSDAAEAAGAAIIGVADGVDTSTSAGRFISELLVAVAKQESANTSVRVKRAQLEASRQGRPHAGGRRAFGWDVGRGKIIPVEAKLIRDATKRILRGESLRSIALAWDAQGVMTPAANAWGPSVLRRMLLSPALAALLEVDGKVITGNWKPIITVEQHERIKAILTDPRRQNAGLGAARTYLLGGFVTCAKCGNPMITRAGVGGKRRYVCARRPGVDACGGTARLAEPVEATVLEMILEVTRGVDVSRFVTNHSEDSSVLVEQVRQDEAALVELSADYYEARAITRPEFMATRGTITARLEANRRQLAGASRTSVLSGAVDVGALIEERWPHEGLDWRRSVLALLVDTVEISPAGRGKPYDPAKIRIVWKN